MEMRHRDVGDKLNEIAKSVIGAAVEVHRILGPGLPEVAYEAALCMELSERKIAFERQFRVPIIYKGTAIGEGIVDLLVEQSLIVELKAVAELLPVHDAQVITYLKLLDAELGLILNFNVALMKSGIRRIVPPAKLRSANLRNSVASL